MMDPDDFRACLISMGYDLVSALSILMFWFVFNQRPGY